MVLLSTLAVDWVPASEDLLLAGGGWEATDAEEILAGLVSGPCTGVDDGCEGLDFSEPF